MSFLPSIFIISPEERFYGIFTNARFLKSTAETSVLIKKVQITSPLYNNNVLNSNVMEGACLYKNTNSIQITTNKHIKHQ